MNVVTDLPLIHSPIPPHPTHPQTLWKRFLRHQRSKHFDSLQKDVKFCPDLLSKSGKLGSPSWPSLKKQIFISVHVYISRKIVISIHWWWWWENKIQKNWPYLPEFLDFEPSTSNDAACLALMHDHADLTVKLTMLVLVLKVTLTTSASQNQSLQDSFISF